MNINNLAQKTNYIAGSSEFESVPFYLTNVNIPGISLNHTEIGGRNSTKMRLSGDTISWNDLTIEMLIDEDFEIYLELMNVIEKNINAETGTFADFTFNFWIEISNSKGNKILKMDFNNCRINSISDITLDSQDDITEHTLTIEINYDYYKIENNTSYIER